MAADDDGDDDDGGEEARTRSTIMLAVVSTGTQDTVSWLGISVGTLPRYFELAII